MILIGRYGPQLSLHADIRRGEYITGFQVNSGGWVDGLAVITSLGRKSTFFGNANGGSP